MLPITPDQIDGLILYGPPASGKDVVTRALERQDDRLSLFRKLKVGQGRTSGYRLSTPKEIDELEASLRLVSRVHRYGNDYYVDAPELLRMRQSGLTPIVHTADLDEVAILRREGNWLVVCLWASARTTRHRLMRRVDSNLDERLGLRSAMLRELGTRRPDFDGTIITDALSPEQVAEIILGKRSNDDGTIDAVISDPDLIVPVVTLRDQQGRVDWAANSEYAARSLGSGVAVLVGGKTGRGESLSPADRDRLARTWIDSVGPSRVIVGHLGGGAPTSHSGARALVVPRLPGFAGLADAAETAPDCVVYSRRSLGWTLPSCPPPEGLSLPFAVKVSGTSARESAVLTQHFPARMRIWHGKSSTASEAWDRGVDGVMVAPLAAAITQSLPTSRQSLVDLISQQRARLVGYSGSAIEGLESLVREALT